MKFRVIDKRTGDDITNDYCWVLRPSGELYYVHYDDLIGLSYAEPIMIPEGDNE